MFYDVSDEFVLVATQNTPSRIFAMIPTFTQQLLWYNKKAIRYQVSEKQIFELPISAETKASQLLCLFVTHKSANNNRDTLFDMSLKDVGMSVVYNYDDIDKKSISSKWSTIWTSSYDSDAAFETTAILGVREKMTL